MWWDANNLFAPRTCRVEPGSAGPWSRELRFSSPPKYELHTRPEAEKREAEDVEVLPKGGQLRLGSIAHEFFFSGFWEHATSRVVSVWFGEAPESGEMRPQSCKSKGRRLQQKVAGSILETFPHLAPDDVVSTSMGAPGEDVRMSPLARQSLPISIECKCVEKINIWSCLQQCEANTPEGVTSCLVFSRNRSPTYAVVPWDALLDLYRRVATDGGELPPRLVALLHEASTFLPPTAE